MFDGSLDAFNIEYAQTLLIWKLSMSNVETDKPEVLSITPGGIRAPDYRTSKS